VDIIKDSKATGTLPAYTDVYETNDAGFLNKNNMNRYQLVKRMTFIVNDMGAVNVGNHVTSCCFENGVSRHFSIPVNKKITLTQDIASILAPLGTTYYCGTWTDKDQVVGFTTSQIEMDVRVMFTDT